MERACINDIAAQSFHEACTLFESKSNEPNVLTLHLPLACLRSGKKQKRSSTDKTRQRARDVLAAKVSALRNSNGGFLLVHLCDKSQTNESIDLSSFDEFADSKLKKLICDGSLYTDCYDRWMLCESGYQVFEEYNNVIVLKVSKTKGVSKVEYNTKIGSDHEVEEPKFYELYSLLTKESNPRGSVGKARGINKRQLYESRSVQLKSFPSNEDRYQKILDRKDVIGLVDCIWDKLRLPEYIASISNIPKGGSYYVGIVEQKESQPDIIGFKFDVPDHVKNLLFETLKDKIRNCVIWNDINSDLEKGGSTLIKTINFDLHPVEDSQNVVLEVCIGHLPGVVFFGDGPVAYKVKGRGFERITVDDWQKLFKSTINN